MAISNIAAASFLELNNIIAPVWSFVNIYFDACRFFVAVYADIAHMLMGIFNALIAT